MAFPARVEAYDAGALTADVRPTIQRRAPSGELEEYPVIPDVPVLFPGGGGFELRFPVTKGDTVLVVVSQRNIGEWHSSGDITDPKDTRVAPLDGAVAIPVLRHAKSAAPSSVIDSDGSVWRIGGADATEHIGLGDTIKSHFDALKIYIDTHIHGTPSGNSTPPTVTSPSVPDVTSQHKVEP